MNHDNNSIVSIVSGSVFSMCTYIENGLQNEFVHVLIVGIIGGAGGYVGKLIIQKIVIVFRK